MRGHRFRAGVETNCFYFVNYITLSALAKLQCRESLHLLGCEDDTSGSLRVARVLDCARAGNVDDARVEMTQERERHLRGRSSAHCRGRVQLWLVKYRIAGTDEQLLPPQESQGVFGWEADRVGASVAPCSNLAEQGKVRLDAAAPAPRLSAGSALQWAATP